MKRKTFLRTISGIFLLSIPAVSLINCSSDNSNGGSDDQPDETNNCTGSISANHGHSLTVSEADVNAAVDKTYNITGDADHSHMVTITADQFVELQNNQQISVSSTLGASHTHPITVSCA